MTPTPSDMTQSPLRRILFLRFSHRDINDDFHALARLFNQYGHDVHWWSLFDDRRGLPTEPGFTYYTQSSPYGNSSKQRFYDLKTDLHPKLFDPVASKGGSVLMKKLREEVETIKPDLIVTSGVIALSAVGALDLKGLMPGVYKPWLHYVDADYKYGTNANAETRKLALALLERHIQQPDCLWAASPAFAKRVTKDYKLANTPEIVRATPRMTGGLLASQAKQSDRRVILFNSQDDHQAETIKRWLKGSGRRALSRYLWVDIALPWIEEGPVPAKTLAPEIFTQSPAIDAMSTATDPLTALDGTDISDLSFADRVVSRFFTKKTASYDEKSAAGTPQSSAPDPAMNALREPPPSIDFFNTRGWRLLDLPRVKRQVVLSLLKHGDAINAVTRLAARGHANHILCGERAAETVKPHLTGQPDLETFDFFGDGPFEHIDSYVARLLEQLEKKSAKIATVPSLSLAPPDDWAQAFERLEHEVAPAAPDGPLRIWHGLTGCAGQPWIQSSAQNRAGAFARSMVVGPNYLGYNVHKHLPDATANASARAMTEIAHRFNVAHFYFRPLFYSSKNVAFPTAMDLLSLRAAGKSVIMNFRGSEVRLQEDFRRLNPYHYVDENPPAVAKFPDEIQRRYLNFTRSICSELVVIDPELGSFVPDAKVIPRSLDLSHWQEVGLKNGPVPVVVHAPTKADIKGTSHVLEAVDALKAEGLEFEFKLVKGMSHSEAQQVYHDADIVIDQLRIGWYGVLSVEAMALGKALMCYIREDIQHTLPSGEAAPFMVTNPDTVKADLRQLLTDANLRQQYAAAGRRYCEQTHDSDKVAQSYLDLYEEVRRNPRPVDIRAVFEFIEWQESLISGETQELVDRIRARVGA